MRGPAQAGGRCRVVRQAVDITAPAGRAVDIGAARTSRAHSGIGLLGLLLAQRFAGQLALLAHVQAHRGVPAVGSGHAEARDDRIGEAGRSADSACSNSGTNWLGTGQPRSPPWGGAAVFECWRARILEAGAAGLDLTLPAGRAAQDGLLRQAGARAQQDVRARCW